MKGRATISLPSVTRSGSAASPRGDGPLTTRAPAFGSYSELWHGQSRILGLAQPVHHLATGVGTDRRVCHHAARRTFRGRRVERRRIQPHQQHLVEARPIAHDIAGRVHGPCQVCPAFSGMLFGCERHRRGIARPDQQVALLRPIARRIGLRAAVPATNPTPSPTPAASSARRPAVAIAPGHAAARIALSVGSVAAVSGIRRSMVARSWKSFVKVQHLPPASSVRYQSSSSLSRWHPIMF